MTVAEQYFSGYEVEVAGKTGLEGSGDQVGVVLGALEGEPGVGVDAVDANHHGIGFRRMRRAARIAQPGGGVVDQPDVARATLSRTCPALA